MDADLCRRRADALLHEAAGATNMRERGLLIDEAVRWHSLALEAEPQPGPDNDNLFTQPG